ncbi:unnamed protein product [Clonostachys rosea]|uniref:Transcription factor domain-containing protein n=1 Tax=Bionectria ochroleuca TaxID=29856 RepID=A0ABY6U374_BIOOC|nr:unnamed protein product [Clonostachys rosea]
MNEPSDTLNGPLRDILSGAAVVLDSELPSILWPSDIPGGADGETTSYDQRQEVIDSLQKFDEIWKGRDYNMVSLLCKLWRVSIAVYRENPLWLLSPDRGLLCSGKSAKDVPQRATDMLVSPFWKCTFTDRLNYLLLHPFFSSRYNSAFLRLSMQFSVAFGSHDNPVWNISNLLREARVQCPILNTLSEEMTRHCGDTRHLGGEGGRRIVRGARMDVLARLGELIQRSDGVASDEARFLLWMGEHCGLPGRAFGQVHDPRDAFRLEAWNLDLIYKAADAAISNPHTEEATREIWRRYNPPGIFQLVDRDSVGEHARKAYRHELHLLLAFTDRRDGIQQQAPLAATNQQIPWHPVQFPAQESALVPSDGNISLPQSPTSHDGQYQNGPSQIVADAWNEQLFPYHQAPVASSPHNPAQHQMQYQHGPLTSQPLGGRPPPMPTSQQQASFGPVGHNPVQRRQEQDQFKPWPSTCRRIPLSPPQTTAGEEDSVAGLEQQHVLPSATWLAGYPGGQAQDNTETPPSAPTIGGSDIVDLARFLG